MPQKTRVSTAMLPAFAAMVGFAVVLARLTLEPSAASVPLTHLVTDRGGLCVGLGQRPRDRTASQVTPREVEFDVSALQKVGAASTTRK
ncbi:hypothetical protein [Streptomyces sp. NPDC058335]|uniref:hypothetical protein n=1 Tax=Streptomyces sp. NPDC058335 TaxID=3346451 RepID=UPI0036627A3D